MWQTFDEFPILIAEDSDDDLILLQRALRNEGFANPQVTVATGKDTIAHFQRSLELHPEESFPVLLFLDLLMPEMGGIEVLKWLRDHQHPPITVVLHTGVDDEALLAQARELGASFYLPKGVRPDAIREVFRRARAEWEQYQLVQG
jgi:CheY-like chemotaxis protein